MSQQIVENPNADTGGSKAVTVGRETKTKPRRLSKLAKAKAIYLENPNLPRETLIQKFMDDLNLPENSANTYASLCARDCNPALGKEYRTRRVNRTHTKYERAFQIFKEHAHLPRKEIIEKLKEALNITYNSAATHCSLAHNRYYNGGV